MRRRGLKARLLDLFSDEEDPKEPYFEPEHVGAVILLSFAGLGALYWLLWTLIVYEGGLLGKVRAAGDVLLTSKTLADYGYLGAPHAMGVFRGWAGNTGALVLCAVLVLALRRLYRDAAAKRRGR